MDRMPNRRFQPAPRYNYLFDADTRKTGQLSLANAVVILDEGHNVPMSAESAASRQPPPPPSEKWRKAGQKVRAHTLLASSRSMSTSYPCEA